MASVVWFRRARRRYGAEARAARRGFRSLRTRDCATLSRSCTRPVTAGHRNGVAWRLSESRGLQRSDRDAGRGSARAHWDRLEDESIDPILRKGLSTPETEFAAALADRERLDDEFVARYLDDAIAVVLPAVPIRTPRMIEVNPGGAEFNPRTLYALSALTRFVNFLGLPALALPAGLDTLGMPLAIQLVGRRQRARAVGDRHGSAIARRLARSNSGRRL